MGSRLHAIRIPDEGPVTGAPLARATRMAGFAGVSVERYIEVVRARRKAKLAKFYRRRRRTQLIEKGRQMTGERPAPGPRKFGALAVYAGEGELEPLLRASGMSQQEFFELAGISHTAFRTWYGHPLYRWPVELVKHVQWARAMAEKLKSLGWNPDDYKPKLPERRMTNPYPRNREQGAKFQLDPPA